MKTKPRKYKPSPGLVALKPQRIVDESYFTESYEKRMAGNVSGIAQQYLSGEIPLSKYLQLEEKIYGNINLAA